MTGTSTEKKLNGNHGKTGACEFHVNLEGRRCAEMLINCNLALQAEMLINCNLAPQAEMLINCNLAPLAHISQLCCPHSSHYALKKMYNNVVIGFT